VAGATTEEGLQRVFLSHSHHDKPFVRLVASELRGAGLAPWLDEVELLPGDSLIVAVSKAVVDASYVVAFLSPTSIASAWVEKELAIAMTVGIDEKRVTVLPVLLPGLDRNGIPALLRDQLFIDLRSPLNYDAALIQLYRRLVRDGTQHDLEILKARYVRINADRAERLVDATKDASNAEWIADYLVAHVRGPQKSPDYTERHFVYWALGEIGGAKASEIVEKGLQETDGFARLGAEIAWRRLKRSP
jgi:TIR domain